MKQDSLRQQRRRTALRVLADEVGSVRALGLQVGTPNTHLGAILAGRRGMGDELAAKLERKTSRPPGWMDDPARDSQAVSVDRVPNAQDEHSPKRPPLNMGGASGGLRLREESHLTDHAPSGGIPALPGITAHEVVMVPLSSAQASMGRGLPVPDEEAVTAMAISRRWLQRHATFTSEENLALVTGFGDSMTPLYEDGDLLLVDRGVQEIKVDGIYCISLNDELFVKRIQRRPGGGLVMRSEHPSYEPYALDPERDKMTVLGRVVLAWNAKRL